MGVANYLTVLRIFISPLFLFIYMTPTLFEVNPKVIPYILLLLLGISELSDALDGYFARIYNQVTDLGKLLDPMADSIYRLSVFLTFTQAPVNLPMWLIFMFLYRDSVISTLRTICALKGFALAARMSGKVKAFLQGAAAFIILLLMIPHSWGYLSNEELTAYSTTVALPIAIYSLMSGIDYIVAYRKYFTKLLSYNAG